MFARQSRRIDRLGADFGVKLTAVLWAWIASSKSSVEPKCSNRLRKALPSSNRHVARIESSFGAELNADLPSLMAVFKSSVDPRRSKRLCSAELRLARYDDRSLSFCKAEIARSCASMAACKSAINPPRVCLNFASPARPRWNRYIARLG